MRARLLHDLTPAGAMLSVSLAEAELRPHLEDGLHIAVVNSDELVVVSGPAESVHRLEQRLDRLGVETRPLRIDRIGHSPELAPIGPGLRDVLERATLAPPSIPYLSNVTGDWMSDEDATDPEYWVRHACSTVRFSDGMRRLLEAVDIVIEVGPGRALTAIARQHRAAGKTLVTSLPPATPLDGDAIALLQALGAVWAAGATVDWSGVFAGEERRRVRLPSYAFQRTRFPLPDGAHGASLEFGPSIAAPPPPPPAALVPTPQHGAADSDLDALEAQIAAVWRDVLGDLPIRRDSSFLELGGDSLLAIRVVMRLRDLTGLPLRLRFFLERPRLGALAAGIVEEQARVAGVDLGQLLEEVEASV